MKKLLLVTTLCLFTSNVYATDFITTLGAECNRILYNLNTTDYPNNWDSIEKRNNQLNSLEKCLNLYYRVGGQMDDLNKRYKLVTNSYFIDCKDAEDFSKCYEQNKGIRQVYFNYPYDEIKKDTKRTSTLLEDN